MLLLVRYNCNKMWTILCFKMSMLRVCTTSGPKESVFPHVLFDHTQRFKRDHNLMVFAIHTVFCHDTNVSINSKVHLLLDVFIISNENRFKKNSPKKKSQKNSRKKTRVKTKVSVNREE